MPLLRTPRDSEMWCTAQIRLGWQAGVTNDFAGALGHFTAVRDVVADLKPSSALVDALAGRAMVLLNVDRIREAAEDARRTLGLARGRGYPAGEALALANLSLIGSYTGDRDNALAWARQAQRIDPARIPGWIARGCGATPDGCADRGRRGGGCGTAAARVCWPAPGWQATFRLRRSA